MAEPKSAVEFEHIEMDKDTEVEVPDYAQVVFHNIAESYPTDANIDCRFTITSQLIPTSRDWVGIYKVGWLSSRDYTYYDWAPMPVNHEQNKDIDSTIVFQAKNLPKDDGEFYQFCYVTQSGQVRGASTPFQFKRPGVTDYVEIEDDDNNMLVIQSKTMTLETSLAKVKTENEQLVKTHDILEVERDSLLNKLMTISKTLATEEDHVEQLQKDVQESNEKLHSLHNEAKDMALVHDALTEKLSIVNMEKEEILKRLDENDSYIKKLQEKIKELNNDKDALVGKHRMLEEEKELFKTHFTSSESTIQAYMKEIDNLKKQLAYLEDIRQKQTEETMRLREELDKERKKLKRQSSVSKTDREHINCVTERLKNTEDKLSAAEHCKKLLNDEVTNIQEAHDKMAQSLAKARSDAHSLKGQLTRLEDHQKTQEQELNDEITALKMTLDGVQEEKDRTINELHQTRESLKQQASQSRTEQDGPMHALRIAQAHLERRLEKTKKQHGDAVKDRDEAIKCLKSKDQLESDMHREIEDLKERLAMGAEEYKEKYIECKKYQLEIRKLQKQIKTNQKAEKVASMETSAVQTSVKSDSKESSTQSDNDSAALQLSSTELQSQLEDLGHELEERNQKKHKYKKLYQEEHEKREFMQNHYYEELKKLRDECERKDSEVDELKLECDQKVESQQRVIDQLNKDMAKMQRELEAAKKQDTAACSPVLKPPQQLYPNPYAEMAKVNAPPPLKYGNPYVDDTEKFVKEDKEKSSSTTSLDEDLPTGQLEEPLKPLPPPMMPEVLPSAKVAAVKQVAKVGPGQGVQSGEGAGLKQLKRHASKEQDDVDEFHDAVGDPESVKLCPTCMTSFQECPQAVYEDHVQSHFVTMCPMCQQVFDKDFPQHDFERHVQRHFDSEANDNPATGDQYF
ncbi:unnamed protein product [Owenia fusiformis]|uniref:Uncharacterized protein n=1 Tax=Owenia fusiformis TaxID=6347 RepID=A0A8J1XQH3_OWEFU|nr:unnamed protein product [Owenia fusiformis]